MPVPYILIAAVIVFAGGMQYVSFDQETATSVDEVSDIIATGIEKNKVGAITLGPGMSREEIAEKIGNVLEFDEKTADHLHNTYRSMQWDAVNEVLVPHLVETHNLTEEDREILLTHSTIYLDWDTDILESLYQSGSYAFEASDTVVDIARALLLPLETNKDTMVRDLLDKEAVRQLLAYVRNETELLPDLVPLPPLDVDIKDEGGRRLLIFTTIYYNQGKGNLELRADPKTIAVIGDFDREVFQRIYRPNNTYRERSAGTFEWHNEHLHYHFIDFIEYKLTAEEGTPPILNGDLAEKSTFCIRDVSRVYIPGVSSTTAADYRICGRERQGVSVGWGDAYFNTYADQNLDITGLPSGEYTLSFWANPENRFDESDLNNNRSSATLRYSKEEGTAEVISTTPTTLPRFEHIHVEQEL